jgi:hypothetical protein
MKYEVWVTEHKYEDTLAYRGESLHEARRIMNIEVGELIGSPPVYDMDTMCYRMIHPQSGLEYWKVEIKEVVSNAA